MSKTHHNSKTEHKDSSHHKNTNNPTNNNPNESKRLPYYSSAEVGTHNIATDCWVSYFNKVYDLTSLIASGPADLANPIVLSAGTDISHWFDIRTGDPKTHIDAITGLQQYYTPNGRYLHIPPPEPVANYNTSSILIPWWRNNDKYLIGNLSRKTRKIKIINILTGQEDILSVCAEETLNDILIRYLSYNSHARSYTWKRLGRILNMNLTLEDNGIIDESEQFEKLNLNEDEYIPAIHIYFNDDLTSD